MGDRPARKPVNISGFSGEYVPYQFAQGRKAAIAMGAGAGLQDLIAFLSQPVMPFLALPLRVIHQIAQIQIYRHKSPPCSMLSWFCFLISAPRIVAIGDGRPVATRQEFSCGPCACRGSFISFIISLFEGV